MVSIQLVMFTDDCSYRVPVTNHLCGINAICLNKCIEVALMLTSVCVSSTASCTQLLAEADKSLKL